MLNLFFITTVPAMIEGYFAFGVGRTLISKSLISVKVIHLRDFAIDDNGTIDDKPYGGGDGMVFRVEPLLDDISFPQKTAW